MLSLAIVFGVTLLVFLVVVGLMAVGVMMGRREISGSCGGLAQQTDQDGQTSCSLCSDPDAACRELGKRMQDRTTSETDPAAGESTDRDWTAENGSTACEQMDAGKRC